MVGKKEQEVRMYGRVPREGRKGGRSFRGRQIYGEISGFGFG